MKAIGAKPLPSARLCHRWCYLIAYPNARTRKFRKAVNPNRARARIGLWTETTSNASQSVSSRGSCPSREPRTNSSFGFADKRTDSRLGQHTLSIIEMLPQPNNWPNRYRRTLARARHSEFS